MHNRYNMAFFYIERKARILLNEYHIPELDYYYSVSCPICRMMERVIDNLQIRLRPDIFIDRICIEARNDKKIVWFRKFCNEVLGNIVVPVVVFWRKGFEVGNPDIFILEKKYSGVLTKDIEERIAVFSAQSIEFFNEYLYEEER